MKLRNKILAIIGILILFYFLWGIIIGICPKARLASGLISISNTVKTELVGFGGYKPMQYRYYEILRTSSEKELIRLLDSKSEAVQCYAYKALVEKEYSGLFDLVKERLHYTNSVKSQAYDMIFSYQVSDYFIYFGDFTTRQREIIDSILIFNNIDIENKKIALHKINPKEKYYDKIRDLAIRKEPEALIALAKYKKEKDIELLKASLREDNSVYSGLLAAREFPTKELLEKVINVYEQKIQKPTGFSYIEIRVLYQALVQYDSKKVDSLLNELVKNYNTTRDYIIKEINENGDTVHVHKESDSPFNSKYKYHTEYLWLALEKYETPYDYLKDSIKIENDWWKEEILKQIDYE